MIAEKKIEQLGYVLRDYYPVAEVDSIHTQGIEIENLVFISGQTSISRNDSYTGVLGKTCPLEEGQRGAMVAVLKSIGALREILGDLDYIEQFVKVVWYITCSDQFLDQEKIVEKAESFLKDIFGNDGVHCRTIVGVSNLPQNACCCAEFTVEIKE